MATIETQLHLIIMATLINITFKWNPSEDTYHSATVFVAHVLVPAHALTGEFLLCNDTFQS